MLLCLAIEMNFRLKIEPKGFSEDFSNVRLFSFAVIDLDKSKSYPQNFVCMLPVNIKTDARTPSAFQRFFGDKSIEQAKTLLIRALDSEDDSAVKAEIERRLKLLEPKTPLLVKCSNCGKPFNPGWARRFRRKLCPDCMAKKYGSRS